MFVAGNPDLDADRIGNASPQLLANISKRYFGSRAMRLV
jgi:hypothetical protein